MSRSEIIYWWDSSRRTRTTVACIFLVGPGSYLSFYCPMVGCIYNGPASSAECLYIGHFTPPLHFIQAALRPVDLKVLNCTPRSFIESCFSPSV